MRAVIKNSKSFFDEILLNKKLSLRELSKIVGCNYSSLKDYRRGELTMPKEIFDDLLEFSLDKNFWISNVEKVEDNWGQMKAGKISALKGNISERMTFVRKFRKVPVIYIKLNEFFCEFYGALLGDGCITKYKDIYNKLRYFVVLVGNLRLDSDYIKYLQKKFKSEYSLYSYYYENKKDNTCRLTIYSKMLATALNSKFEVPIGKKYDAIHICKTILKSNWSVKKFVLRGLFDTDGCIFARKDEGYRLPHISICSKSKSFREQICNLLREQGYPAYLNNINVRIKGIKNVKRWFSDIGSSNPRNLFKYEYFLKHGNLPAGLLR